MPGCFGGTEISPILLEIFIGLSHRCAWNLAGLIKENILSIKIFPGLNEDRHLSARKDKEFS